MYSCELKSKLKLLPVEKTTSKHYAMVTNYLWAPFSVYLPKYRTILRRPAVWCPMKFRYYFVVIQVTRPTGVSTHWKGTGRCVMCRTATFLWRHGGEKYTIARGKLFNPCKIDRTPYDARLISKNASQVPYGIPPGIGRCYHNYTDAGRRRYDM